MLEFYSKEKKHWFANHTIDQIHDLVSEFDSMGFSSSPLSELEQDIVACIENMKEHWKHIDSGIRISRLVSEILPRHQGKVDMDFWSVVLPVTINGLLT